jgi:hypothetical protein
MGAWVEGSNCLPAIALVQVVPLPVTVVELLVKVMVPVEYASGTRVTELFRRKPHRYPLSALEYALLMKLWARGMGRSGAYTRSLFHIVSKVMSLIVGL